MPVDLLINKDSGTTQFPNRDLTLFFISLQYCHDVLMAGSTIRGGEEAAIARQLTQLEQEFRLGLKLNHHNYDPRAIPLFTVEQAVHAFQEPASRLIGEVVQLQRKLLQNELAQEASRTAPNPEVAAGSLRKMTGSGPKSGV
jgi:hypothetical protein